MRFSISEMAKLSGISIRTLHYYDEIGLLKPSEVVSDTGYRYYDMQAAERLQQILFYRELDFQLKEITDIMNASGYRKEDALKKQKELLLLKKARLERLIALLDANLKGEHTMDFEKFDMNEIEQARKSYAAEVKEKWGNTSAYEQSREKTGKYKKEDWAALMEESDDIMRRFSEHVGEDPASAQVQELVRSWQQHITKSYYDCTKEILAGLGEMYVADERFLSNINRFGEGTAELMHDAIRIYCK